MMLPCGMVLPEGITASAAGGASVLVRSRRPDRGTPSRNRALPATGCSRWYWCRWLSWRKVMVCGGISVVSTVTFSVPEASPNVRSVSPGPWPSPIAARPRKIGQAKFVVRCRRTSCRAANKVPNSPKSTTGCRRRDASRGREISGEDPDVSTKRLSHYFHSQARGVVRDISSAPGRGRPSRCRNSSRDRAAYCHGPVRPRSCRACRARAGTVAPGVA